MIVLLDCKRLHHKDIDEHRGSLMGLRVDYGRLPWLVLDLLEFQRLLRTVVEQKRWNPLSLRLDYGRLHVHDGDTH